jgi:hypothetical protein
MLARLAERGYGKASFSPSSRNPVGAISSDQLFKERQACRCWQAARQFEIVVQIVYHCTLIRVNGLIDGKWRLFSGGVANLPTCHGAPDSWQPFQRFCNLQTKCPLLAREVTQLEKPSRERSYGISRKLYFVLA